MVVGDGWDKYCSTVSSRDQMYEESVLPACLAPCLMLLAAAAGYLCHITIVYVYKVPLRDVGDLKSRG